MEGSCWNHRDTEFLGEDSCCYFRAQREPSILSPQIVTQREQCVQRSHLMVQGGRPASTNVTLHHQSTLGQGHEDLHYAAGKEGCRLLVSEKPKVSHVRVLCHHPDWVRVLKRISLNGVLLRILVDTV